MYDERDYKFGRIIYTLFILLLVFSSSFSSSAEFSVHFKDTEIKEFINTVSKNLNRTIIIDPTVKGLVTVRTYELLDEEQYYQFFLNVLDVHGYVVVNMPNSVLKVIPARKAKDTAIPVTNNSKAMGDELVNKIVPLKNIAAKNIAPLLRQLNDSAGSGSVIHYESANVLLITGRAAIVERLLSIINDVDKSGDLTIDKIKLNYAGASEVVRIINELIKSKSKSIENFVLHIKVIADERTNSILIGGDEHYRKKIIMMIKKLDQEQVTYANTKVIYLKYAKAENLLDVLNGVRANTLQGEKKTGSTFSSAASLMKNLIIKADSQTNALIITAAPDIMNDLELVIEKLDIQRAQVLVEAIIVEVQDSDGLNLGVQWVNKYGGGTSFSKVDTHATDLITSDQKVPGIISSMKGINGLAAGFYRGNWSALFTALASNSRHDILATPSIVTLDNMEAEFNVGQEVPVLTNTQTTLTDKVFNTVVRKPVGIMLKVKPQINKGDSVLLEIRQEVSSVAETPPNGTNELGATFNTRTVNNAVLVKSGETVVVGGLLDKTNVNSVYKVPFLGDIPWIEALFR